jgi:hypothetical protein
MDEPHVERVTEDEGDVLLRAQVGEPVPTVDALDGDDQILAKRRDREEEPLWIAGQAAVQQHHALAVDDAEVQRPRVEVDPAVVLVRRVVEPHRALLPSAARWVYSPPCGHPPARGPV